MEPTQITCARVDEEDLDARYLAGTLSEEEAEAFEEHYFACDRCWSTVQLGRDVRAASDRRASAAALEVRRVAPAGARAISRARWMPVAIAAALTLVAVGLWQRSDPRAVIPSSDPLRGPNDSIPAVASVSGRTLMLRWQPVPDADRYRVRLQRSDASVVLERLIANTAVSVVRDSLPEVDDGERVYWEVQALDGIRRTIARSRLVPTVIPGARP